ncbi:MAG: hypothetical protein WD136_05805 [Cyanobium sp.]
MACPKCGCRLITKVGRSKTMLICADCGHPQGPSITSRGFQWNQLSSVALLLAIAAVAIALTLLSDAVTRNQSPLSEPARLERTE